MRVIRSPFFNSIIRHKAILKKNLVELRLWDKFEEIIALKSQASV